MAEKATLKTNDSFESEQISNHIESKLLRLLDIVSTWLRFAESKNNNLILFCVAAIAAVSTSFAGNTAFEPGWRLALLISLIPLSVSCVVSLTSFFPEINPKKILASRKGVPCDDDNLYFYGDLCKYEPKELIDAIARSHSFEAAFEPSKFHLDLAAQIVVNSRIAVLKYKVFKKSLVIAMLSVAAPVVLIAKMFW